MHLDQNSGRSKTQVFAKTQVFFAKLRVKNRKTQVFVNKKLSVFKLKNASTERFYVLMAGKKLLMPSMETSKQEFSKLRSIFVKNSGHKTAKLRSDEQKTQVRVSKTQVFGNKVFVFV